MIDTAVSAPEEYDFAKMKVGLKTLDDAVVKLGTLGKTNKKFADKDFVLKNIKERNYEVVRKISEYYYDSSGIYARLCQYLAYLYKYDWFVTPYISKENLKKDQIVEIYKKALLYLDNLPAGTYVYKFQYGVGSGTVQLNEVNTPSGNQPETPIVFAFEI